VIYRVANPGAAYPAYLAVAMNHDASELEDRTRAIAATVDARLRVKSIMPMSRLGDDEVMTLDFFYRVLAIVGSVALLLSTAGVYSLMSFSVARRRREIAIRAALGASPHRLLSAIFSRAFWQLGTGVVIGLVPGALLLTGGAPEVAEGSGLAVGLGGSMAVGVFMMTVGLLACAGPARRALRIQPTDALRAES
jgi:putative ABC transport system permease protein